MVKSCGRVLSRKAQESMHKATMINKIELSRECSLAMSKELTEGNITLDDINKVTSVLATLVDIVIDNPKLIEDSLRAIPFEQFLNTKEED